MRTALIVSLSLGWLAGAALAQTAPQSPKPKAPDTSVQPPADSPSNKGPGRSDAVKQPGDAKATGGVGDALTSCLEMWEPATHMSRQEWSRACRRVADRLKNTAVK